MRYYKGLGLLIILIFILTGCGSDDNGASPGNGTTPTEGSIGPEGGTVEIANKISLTIPAGALADTVDFSISTNSSPATPPGSMGFLSSAYTIEPSGTNFSSPAIISINYNEQSLGGADEDSVKICTNEGSGWSDLSGTVNKSQNLVTANISHLSDFAAMADTTSPSNEGVFAALALAATITDFDISAKAIPIRMDAISARFDSTYAPCSPIVPIQPAAVSCDEYDLVWNSEMGMFYYSDYINMSFLETGEWYTFDVTAGGGVPNFSDSIEFPTTLPYITSPAYGSNVSSSGFDIAWEASGSGEVYLIFVEMGGQGDSALFIQTANDGAYSVSEAELDGLDPGVFALTMVYENWHYINVAGIDSRSFIRARVISTTQITLQ